MEQLQTVINQIGTAFDQFKAEHRAENSALKKQIEALETVAARGAFPGGGSGGTGAISPAAREYGKAFDGWARRGVGEDVLASSSPRAELSTLSDPDGGFLVPEEVEKTIDKLARESVAMRRIAKIVRASGQYSKIISMGGAAGGWVSEKQDRTDTDSPELATFNPPWCEVFAMPTATQKLLDLAAFDVETWLSEEISDTFTEYEGDAFITGNGVGQPKGFLAYYTVANASYAWQKIGYIATGEAAAFGDYLKLIDLQHALKPVYRQNGVWLMNDSTWSHIRKFQDGDGGLIWRPGLEKNAPDILLGKPVEIDDNMPDIAADAYAVAFGDFSRAYTIGDHRSGIRLLRDPFTKKGFVRFYTTKRVFGGVSNFEAVKLLKISAS